MSYGELFLVAIGLSMDAFAVAICTGLSLKKSSVKSSLTVGGYFGFFQGLMPFIGYFMAAQFADKIKIYDHWIAFVLLGIIGLMMIKEAVQGSDSCKDQSSLALKDMLPLSIATSIDALAMGVSFAFLDVDILPTAILIGVVTFVVSAMGVEIGNKMGSKLQKSAGIIGGVILITLGTKVLLEHTGVI